MTQATKLHRTEKHQDGLQYYVNLGAVMAEFGLTEEELLSIAASNPSGANSTLVNQDSDNGTWDWFMGFQIGDARSGSVRALMTACNLLVIGNRAQDKSANDTYMGMVGIAFESCVSCGKVASEVLGKGFNCFDCTNQQAFGC